MSELKPCPNPECSADDSIDIQIEHSPYNDWYTCFICGVQGPFGEGYKEAMRLWNLLPRLEDE